MVMLLCLVGFGGVYCEDCDVVMVMCGNEELGVWLYVIDLEDVVWLWVWFVVVMGVDVFVGWG